MGGALGNGVNVDARGIGVNEGIRVGVDSGGVVVAVWGSGGVVVPVKGRGASVTEGIIWKKVRNKHQQHAVGKRMNIIIKKRRMDIL